MSVIINDVNGNAYKIVLNFSESQSMSVIILTPPNPPKYCGHFWKISKNLLIDILVSLDALIIRSRGRFSLVVAMNVDCMLGVVCHPLAKHFFESLLLLTKLRM